MKNKELIEQSKKQLTPLRAKLLSIVNYISALLILNCFSTHAQIPDKYEIGLSGSAGLSALQFTTVDGNKPTYRVGYSFGWDFTYLLTEQWALRTGANMTSYNAYVSFDRMDTRSIIKTPDGLPPEGRFLMLVEYKQYEELHEALYLRFPLMAQYLTSAGVNKDFYLAAGLQVGLLANASYRLRSGSVETKGFSDFTLQYYEGFAIHGFDKYSKVKSSNKPGFGLAMSCALETGLKWRFNNGTALYTGVFLDYALNDVRKGSLEELIVYDKYGAHTFNSILHSLNDSKAIIEKVLPLAVGVRIRFCIGFK